MQPHRLQPVTWTKLNNSPTYCYIESESENVAILPTKLATTQEEEAGQFCG